VGSHVSMVVESKGTLAIDFDILYIRKIERRNINPLDGRNISIK
jgi:hypothetical protein